MQITAPDYVNKSCFWEVHRQVHRIRSITYLSDDLQYWHANFNNHGLQDKHESLDRLDEVETLMIFYFVQSNLRLIQNHIIRSLFISTATKAYYGYIIISSNGASWVLSSGLKNNKFWQCTNFV